MKTIKNIITTAAIVMILGVFASNAQSPPPPNGGSNPGSGHTAVGDSPGGGAPIAGGMGVLLALGAMYGSKKVYSSWKEQRE